MSCLTPTASIAEDEAFVRELSAFKGGFEVYLQFDGLTDDIYQKLRGKSLAAMQTKALGTWPNMGAGYVGLHRGPGRQRPGFG